jgi:hypothetical protein
MIIVLAAKTALGGPDEIDPALLAPLDGAVGITDADRAGAPDLITAMLRIQRAYLVYALVIPQEIAAYDRCILPQIRRGGYSYKDGGASAWKLRLACGRTAATLIDGCKRRFGIGPADGFARCNLEPVLLAQAAMSVTGE